MNLGVRRHGRWASRIGVPLRARPGPWKYCSWRHSCSSSGLARFRMDRVTRQLSQTWRLTGSKHMDLCRPGCEAELRLMRFADWLICSPRLRMTSPPRVCASATAMPALSPSRGNASKSLMEVYSLDGPSDHTPGVPGGVAGGGPGDRRSAAGVARRKGKPGPGRVVL